MPVLAVSLTMAGGSSTSSDVERMASSRNRVHPAGPRPDGRGSFRCLTPASVRSILPPGNRLKTAARGPNGTPAARYASAQASECLRVQFDPVFGQKRPPGGVKKWPRSGLAGDFRHLAVVRQASRATMGVSRLMVKSSEWLDIAAFPAAQAKAGGRKWRKYEGHPCDISLSGPRTRIREGWGASRAPGA